MKLLVLTSEAITAQQLRGALPHDLDPAEAEVLVVAPALQSSGLRFWLSDADDAIAKAREISASTADRLEREGMATSADTGESDPVKAIEDALQTFDAERIVLFKHPHGRQAYREDVNADELRQRFGRPVDEAVLAPDASS